MKIFLASFLLILAFQISFGQEKQEARLIDEIGSIPCDPLLTRLIHFRDDFVSNDSAQTYIIIYGGEEDHPIQKYRQKVLLTEYWKFLKLPLNKMSFLHGNNEKTSRIQFWLVPNSAKRPDFEEGTWDYTLPITVKPMIFHKKSWISEVCAETFSWEFYSKFLLANPNFNGNLVIYEKSLKNFQKTRKRLFKDLVLTFKIPSSQIKTFYVKSNESDIEYWLVPKRRKS